MEAVCMVLESFEGYKEKFKVLHKTFSSLNPNCCPYVRMSLSLCIRVLKTVFHSFVNYCELLPCMC